MYSVAMALIFIKYNTRSYISYRCYLELFILASAVVLSLARHFGINTLSLLFCVLFIRGYSRIAMGFKDRAMKGRYWYIFIGIIDLIIASPGSALATQLYHHCHLHWSGKCCSVPDSS